MVVKYMYFHVQSAGKASLDLLSHWLLVVAVCANPYQRIDRRGSGFKDIGVLPPNNSLASSFSCKFIMHDRTARSMLAANNQPCPVD